MDEDTQGKVEGVAMNVYEKLHACPICGKVIFDDDDVYCEKHHALKKNDEWRKRR